MSETRGQPVAYVGNFKPERIEEALYCHAFTLSDISFKNLKA
jgi:hypothetical protein